MVYHIHYLDHTKISRMFHIITHTHTHCGGTKRKHPGSPTTPDRQPMGAISHSPQTTETIKGYLPEDGESQVCLSRSTSTD